MPIFEIGDNAIHAVSPTTFGAAGIKERSDLQRLLRDQIEVVAQDLLVIAEEFSDWQDSRRSIDLLAVDKGANLVVIELKRTEDGGHMELQAVRYASMVSTLTAERAVLVVLGEDEPCARQRPALGAPRAPLIRHLRAAARDKKSCRHECDSSDCADTDHTYEFSRPHRLT